MLCDISALSGFSDDAGGVGGAGFAFFRIYIGCSGVSDGDRSVGCFNDGAADAGGLNGAILTDVDAACASVCAVFADDGIGFSVNGA